MASAGITPEQFAERMGLNADYVRQCCRGDIDRGRKRVLPDGWTARQEGARERWLIYKIADLARIEREKQSRTEFHEHLLKNGIKLDDHEIEYIEQQIERDSRFEVGRRTVLAKMLQLPAPSNGEEQFQQDKALGLIAKRVTNLMSDSELIQMLLHRWSLGIEINEPEDYAKHLSALDGTSAYLRTRDELKHGSEFFSRIKHYYRAAASSGESVTVPIEFLPDGKWIIGNRAPADEQVTEAVLTQFGSLGCELEDLVRLFWRAEIFTHERETVGDMDTSRRNELIHSFADWQQVIDHPARPEFLTRCQHCGKQFKTARSNKRFCADDDAWYSANGKKQRTDCRAEHAKWLKRWCTKFLESLNTLDTSITEEQRSEQRTEFIANRLKDYRSHINT